MGANGGPDWRAMMAGDDEKAIERLSRFQTPGDVWKSYREMETKVSKGLEPMRLPDNPSVDQITAYRKGLGLPEVPQDAKPDAYMEAYKIKAPDGYAMSEVEKGMLTDFAKLAYEQGHSPREVQAATKFFFQQQAASQQAVNKLSVEFQKKEQSQLRDELGSKEYEAQQAAATAWLQAQFQDNQEGLASILNAQLPGGGKLGDSAWLFKLAAKNAMGEGYTDRIQANAFEANGKSLSEQQSEIENLRFKNKAGYDEAMKPGGRYEQILDLRFKRGEIDERGNVVERRRA